MDDTSMPYAVHPVAAEQPQSRGNVGRSEYEQLCAAVQEYLAHQNISMINYSGQWGVTANGQRVFFWGAGDAFEYATKQIGVSNGD